MCLGGCSPAAPYPRDVFSGVFTCTSMSTGCAQECVHLHLHVLGVCSPAPPYPRCVFMGVFTCTSISTVCVHGCVHLHLHIHGVCSWVCSPVRVHRVCSGVCSPAPPCPGCVFKGVFTCTSVSSGYVHLKLVSTGCVHLHHRVQSVCLRVCSPAPPCPRGVFT